MPLLRLALAQLNVTVGDMDGNCRLIAESIRRAQSHSADVVVVPELAVCGYPPEDLLLKASFVEANLKALQHLVPATRGIAALVGFVDRDKSGRLFNAAAVLVDGRHAATYHKQYLPNYGVFDEKRYFSPGDSPLLLEIEGIRLGVTLCEDLWMEEPCRLLAASGASLVVNLSASPYYAGKLKEREQLFARRAKENQTAIAYCNLVGGQDELVFDGASLLLDAKGKRLMHAAQFREDFVVMDMPLPKKRAVSGRLKARRLPRIAKEYPRLLQHSVRTLGPVEEIYEALRLGLRDYLQKNGFSTAVLGLSGGIDSALTACIAVDALGASRVAGVVMPSRYSSRKTQQDARLLARALGIALHEISIETVFRAYLKTLKPVLTRGNVDLARQNIQARIRGNLLMSLSNAFGWLVLTTGNKSEMATGYTTLYGDMAGGFAVIKDVPKTLVYKLARFRNQRGKDRPIPESVFRRAPTAELAPNQTDQDTLPPYPVLDRILKAYVEEDQGLRRILRKSGAKPGIIRRTIEMVDSAEYKRRQGPPGIKITPKAFGRDRRMPITNRYRESE